jgi:hypothetical protein
VRTAAGLALLLALTAAFTYSRGAIAPKLSVEKARYEVAGPEQQANVDFTVSPPLDRGQDFVLACSNQRLDRSKLSSAGGCKEQNLHSTRAEEGHATIPVQNIGHYEAFVERRAVDDDGARTLYSDIVSFDVFDHCRLVFDVAPLPPTPGTMVAGAPAPCSGSGNRKVTFHGDDGTRLRINAAGAVSWYYDTRQIRAPLFRINGQGKQVAIEFRTGPRLGGTAAEVSVPAVALFTTSSVDLSIAHGNGTATVRVKRGTVVGFRVAATYGSQLVGRACPGRPTLRCLKKVHYPVGGLKRREEYGKVLRAGQTARFKYRGVR